MNSSQKNKENIIDEKEFIEETFGNSDTTYLTHKFHPYTAKFVPPIPNCLIKKLSKEGETILDPFCGSGTTLVESLLLKRNAIGIDLNYIATLISKAKVTPLSNEQIIKIKEWKSYINLFKNTFTENHDPGKLTIKSSEAVVIKNLADELDYPKKYHWFEKDTLNILLNLKEKIAEFKDVDIRNFLFTALSNIVIKVSKQESETRYVAIKKDIAKIDIFNLFLKILGVMIERIQEYSKLVSKANYVKIIQGDSRYISIIKPKTIDLIITSPPYANTYDYYLYHKMRMIILGYPFEEVKNNEIGSRNKHSSKGEGIQSFIEDMILCFNKFYEFLKLTGYLVIIIGDSVIRKKQYSGLWIIQQIAEKSGFEVIQHFNYNMDDISKSFNKSFRQKNKMEWIIILKKKTIEKTFQDNFP